MPLKIALFTDTFTPDVNGVALTLSRFVNYLIDEGHEVKVFAPSSKVKTNDSNDDSNDDSVHRYASLPFILYPELQAALANPIDIYSKLDQFQPDLIHVATPFLGLIGRHYALKHDIPLVASYHTNFDQYLSSYKLKWAETLLDNYMSWFHEKCLAVYAPSQVTVNELREKGYPNVQIWSRGVDQTLFKPAEDKEKHQQVVLSSYGLDPNKKTVLYVGRLASEKSIDIVVEVCQKYSGRQDVQFILVGDGPIRKEIEETVKQDHLPMYLLGFKEKEELAELYAAADVFLFPSTTETFGNVVLEALSAGVPVVGANAGGVKTLVQPNANGYLCAPNSVGDFYSSLEHLLNHEEKRQSYGIQARKFAETHSWASIFDQLIASYHQVIGQETAYTEAL